MKRMMSRFYAVLVATYVCTSVFCFAAPTVLIQKILMVLWMFGPPANLIHGTKYLWPFLLGSVLIFSLAFAFCRTRALVWRVVLVLGLSVIWISFGVLAYAPGA